MTPARQSILMTGRAFLMRLLLGETLQPPSRREASRQAKTEDDRVLYGRRTGDTVLRGTTDVKQGRMSDRFGTATSSGRRRVIENLATCNQPCASARDRRLAVLIASRQGNRG
jgi:hypothetical protein